MCHFDGILDIFASISNMLSYTWSIKRCANLILLFLSGFAANFPTFTSINHIIAGCVLAPCLWVISGTYIKSMPIFVLSLCVSLFRFWGFMPPKPSLKLCLIAPTKPNHTIQIHRWQRVDWVEWKHSKGCDTKKHRHTGWHLVVSGLCFLKVHLTEDAAIMQLNINTLSDISQLSLYNILLCI